ncbi:MAG: VCBS repeat-containing protein [Acidobacteria bacterium]|nr:VCBS repeat-containing protein [Acidobacteriota bacterium]
MKTNKMSDNRSSRVLKRAVSLAIMLSLATGILIFTPAKAEAAASQLDQTFGSGGKVFYSTVSGTGGNGDIEIQPDGKAVVVGMNGFEVARFNVNGAPDNTFDGDGLAQVPSLRQANALAIQTDGKIVVAGFSLTGDTNLALARFNSNGSLDTTFDGDGIAILVLPNNQDLFDIAIQPDGKIVVGGNTGTNDLDQDFLVVRFNANGTPDASFGPTGTGVIQTSFNAGDSLGSIALQTDGKIVAGGYTFGTGIDFALLRITATGSLDTTFDTDGKLTTSVRQEDFLNKVLIQPNGKIIATGYTRSPGQNFDVAVVRYDPTGALDTSFDVDGIATTNDAPFEETTAAALQPDGKIIVAERRDFNTSALIRFNPNGSLDTSFHGDGIFKFPASNYTNTWARAIAVQPDGKIIISGPQGPNIFLSRLLGDPRQSFTNFNGIFPADRTANTNPPGVPSNYPSIADINSLSGTVTKVRVTLTNFTHTFPGDLDILLVGPNGQRTILMSDAGGGNPGVTGRTYIFDQSAAANFPTTSAPSGIYKPFNGDGPANIEPGAIDVFPTPGPGSNNYGAANLDVFNGTDPNGIWNLYVVDDELGDTGFLSTFTLEVTTTTSRLNNLTADFDGDGRTEVSIFRPSNGEWWYLRSFDGANRAFQFGQSSDKIVPADFTGDGKTDIAFFRPSNGEWFILRSENSSFFSFPFGATGDIPVPADFDGDGRADPAVFRPSNQTWYIQQSTDGTLILQFGAAGDKPVVADYDGDGKADLAIFRPSVGEWWYLRSSDGANRAFQFGNANDKPVPGDFTGDGRADIAFWRAADGFWYILRSEDESFFSFPFGLNGDIPAPGDFDGDGKFDPTVFRPSTATWYSNRSTAGQLAVGFGISTDRPVPSAFIP